MAIAVTQIVGSWSFIVAQSVYLGAWIVLNVLGWVWRWDPYPFILLNAADVHKILRILEEHGQMLTILLEQRDLRDRTRL